MRNLRKRAIRTSTGLSAFLLASSVLAASGSGLSIVAKSPSPQDFHVVTTVGESIARNAVFTANVHDWIIGETSKISGPGTLPVF